MTERCENCRFYKPIAGQSGYINGNEQETWGLCRRHAPARHGVNSGHPEVIPGDWCGEWEQRSEEIKGYE